MPFLKRETKKTFLRKMLGAINEGKDKRGREREREREREVGGKKERFGKRVGRKA